MSFLRHRMLRAVTGLVTELPELPDISAFSYDDVSFSANSQDTLLSCLYISPDGTKMFISGAENSSVYLYTLSTAWDISTASYSSVSLDVSLEISTFSSVFFNPDGTKMFITGTGSGFVREYDLSTGFDLTTVAYNGSSFAVSSQATAPQGIVLNPDGTKMFIVCSGTDKVYQYTLTTGFDITTASYDSVSLDVATQDTSPLGLTFNTDGTKLYIAGNQTDAIHQYTLTTGFDLTTANYDSVSLDVATVDSIPQKVVFSSDRTKMFYAGGQADSVYQYSLN